MKFVPGEIYKSIRTGHLYIHIWSVPAPPYSRGDRSECFFSMQETGIHFWYPSNETAEIYLIPLEEKV